MNIIVLFKTAASRMRRGSHAKIANCFVKNYVFSN